MSLKSLAKMPLAWMYLLMIIVMFVLPFYSSPNYSIARNTTSHLGAQQTPNAIVMNLIFVGLGLTTMLEAMKLYKHYPLLRVISSVFGLSLILTGIYRHAPIDSVLSYNTLHDRLHSLFASSTGFSFTFLAFGTAFVLRTLRDRLFAIGVAIGATVLSILMFQISALAGIWQRIIFAFCFAWLLYSFNVLGDDDLH